MSRMMYHNYSSESRIDRCCFCAFQMLIICIDTKSYKSVEMSIYTTYTVTMTLAFL